MKKFLLYFFAFVFICFLLPALFTKQNIKVADSEPQEEQQNEEIILEPKYDYKKYGTIKLLHKETGEVEEVEIDSYLYHVVSAEMPADYELEALKAQAIVARTYTIYKALHPKHENADICDDSTCCQAWISKQDRLEKWDKSEREDNWNKRKGLVGGKKIKEKVTGKKLNNVSIKPKEKSLLIIKNP